MPEAAPLSIVVINYASHRLLARNLAPLTGAQPAGPTVVVDNFSTTSELLALRELAQRHDWEVVSLPKNEGFGAGANAGARAALGLGAGALMFLNPDAVATTAAVRRMAEEISVTPHALLSPHIRRPDGSTWFRGGTLDMATGSTLSRPPQSTSYGRNESGWITGAALVTSRSLWQRLGGFDPAYFLYWEDVDISFRALALGAELRVVDEAEVIHDEGGTQERGSAPLSNDYYYYNIRNRLLFARSHLDPRERRRWQRSALTSALQIVRRGGRRQLLSSTAAYSAMWQGTRDGLAGRSGPRRLT